MTPDTRYGYLPNPQDLQSHFVPGAQDQRERAVKRRHGAKLRMLLKCFQHRLLCWEHKLDVSQKKKPRFLGGFFFWHYTVMYFVIPMFRILLTLLGLESGGRELW